MTGVEGVVGVEAMAMFAAKCWEADGGGRARRGENQPEEGTAESELGMAPL